MAEQTKKCGREMYAATVKTQQLLSQYSSTVFACDISGDTRYIRCDFPQCRQHAAASQGKHCWLLNTLKNVKFLEGHVGKEVDFYMKEKDAEANQFTSTDNIDSKCFLETQQLQEGVTKVLAVFNLKDPQSQFGDWISLFLKAAFMAEGTKDEDCVVITQDFVSRCELMECIAKLEFLNNCSPTVEVIAVLSCHSSCQGQVFSCTPTAIGKQTGFEEFCSLHDFVMACQNVLKDALTAVHVSSCFTLKLDCSHTEWPVDADWLKTKLRCILCGSTKEVYETGSQVADLHLMLSAMLPCQTAGACGTRLKDVVHRACSEGFPDLAREMGLEVVDPNRVGDMLLSAGKEDQVTPPGLVMSSVRVVLIVQDDSFSRTSDVQDEHRNPGSHVSLASALVANLKMRKASDVKFEYTVLPIKHDKTSFLNTKASIKTHLDLLPCDNLKVMFVAIGPVFSNPNVQLIECIKEWRCLKRDSGCYGVHFQHITAMQAYFIKNRLKETQQASESAARTSFIDDGGKEPSQGHLAVTGLVDNGTGNCSSSFPVLLYMIHLAIGENGNRLAGKGIPSAVYSNKPVGHGMSSWTLEEVYMETCHVLSGLSRKCGLHLLSPASNPVTRSSNPVTPSPNPVTLSSNPVTASSNPVTLSNSTTPSSNSVIRSSKPVTSSSNPLTPSSSSSSSSRVTVNTEVRTKGEHTAELGVPSNFDEMPVTTRKESGNAPASCLASSSPGTTVKVDAETARKEANINDFFQERDGEAAPSSCDEMPIAPEKKSNDSSASNPVAPSAKAIKDRMDSMMATKEAHTVELVHGMVRSSCDEMPITRKEESGDSSVSIPVTPSTRSITDSRDSEMETEEAHTIKLVREKHGNIGPSSCDEMPATLKEGSGDSPVSIPVTASTSSITVGRGAVMETKGAHTFELVQENDGHIGPSSCDEMHTMLNKKSGNSTASVSVTPSAGTIMVTIDAKTKTKEANLIGLVQERNELAAPSCRDETPIATTEEVSYLPASSPITLSASTTCVRTDAETTIKETNIFELVQEKAERLSPSSSDEMAIQLKKESGDTLVPHHVAPFSSASTVAVGGMTTTVKGNAAEIVQGRDGHVATFICNKMPVVPDSASVSSESLLLSSSKPSNLETENHNSRVERIVDIKDSFDYKGAETSEIVKDPCKILSVQHSGVILHLDPAMKRSTTKCLLGSDVPVDCESIPFGVSCDSQPNKDFNRCTKLSTCRTDKGCDRSTEGTPLYNEKSSDDCDVNASAMSQRARKETVHKDDDDVGSSSGDGLLITYEDSRVLEGTLSRSMSEPFSLETETDKRSDSEGDLNENDGCKVTDATQGIGQEPYSRENCEPSLEGSLDTGLHSEDVLVDVESVFPNSPCNDLLTFSSNKGEEPTVGIPVYTGTTVCGSTNSSTSKTKKKKKKHAKPNKTQKWLRNFVRFCKKQEGTSDCETQTSHGMRSKRLKDAGDSSAARPVSEYSASTVYVSENLQSKNKSSGVTKGKGSCQANLEVKINKGTILPCNDHDLRQELSPSSSGLRLEESIDKIHVVMSSQSGRREANTGLDCASRNDEEGANSERADLDGISPSSEMEVDSESKSFRKRPLEVDSACKTMHVPAKLPRIETHPKDQTRTENLSEMSESAGSSKWDESGDLPLMANVDEVLVTHYILDLTVEFSEKVMKGSIVLFLEPSNDEVTERQFQMTLDSTLVNIESVSEVVLPDDFQVPLGSLDQSCGPKPSSQESSSQWTDEETLPSFVGNFLGDKAQNPLPYKGLNYSVYGWCVRIWKPGATGQSWPRCVWIKYHTSPEGKSLTWATDQDGRPTVYSPGAYINNRSLMPCQEPSVALSTWQASIHVPEGCVVLMSGNRLAGKTLTNEGLVTYHYEMDTPLPCSTLALAVGWWQCRQSIDAATKNGNEPAMHVSCRMFAPPSLLDRAADELLDFAPKFLEAACELLGPYPFRRLDVLVLPRCFACMGLKSPNLVFLSQSLLSGDGSMRVRLAHEISHAWFGLLLGAKDWSEEWLSEGFATFVEEKIQSKAEKWSEDKDRFFRELRQILRHRCLLSEIRECDANLRCLRPRKVKSSTAISAAEAVKRSSDQSEAIRPHTVVQFGQISSRKWTQVHYLKGYFLLHHMATMVGLEEFYQFLFNYVQHYKGQLVTSEDFFEFFVQSFSSISKDAKDNFNREWLESPRIPKSFPKSFDSPDNEMTSQVEEEFITWKKQDAVNKRNKTLKAKKRKKPPVTRLAIPEQVVLFLEKLLERETISHSTLRQLNKCYNFTSGNAEIRHRWCELIVKHKFNQELMEVKRFLVEDQGMGIYLFGELIISQQAKQRALVDEVLEEIGPEMDRCTYQTVKDMLEGND